MEVDLEASLRRLAEWLAEARRSEWSPTPEVKRLRALADHLDRTAEALEKVAGILADPDWLDLEVFVDGQTDAEGRLLPAVHGCDVHGNPLPREFHFGRFGYAPIQSRETAERLREIANKAREQAGALPRPRTRPELEFAAEVFAHLWYEAGKPLPTLYDTNKAVIAFQEIINRDSRHARRLLKVAFGLHKEVVAGREMTVQNFDPLSLPPGFDRFLVYRDQ